MADEPEHVGESEPVTERRHSPVNETAKRRREHLRDHLTDGHWHDSCPWCLRRRVHGGNGTEGDSDGR